MSDCPRFGKWFGACKFAPRYDQPVHDLMGGFRTITFYEAMTPQQITALKDGDSKIIYVRDVCVRCGKVIERAKP